MVEEPEIEVKFIESLKQIFLKCIDGFQG